MIGQSILYQLPSFILKFRLKDGTLKVGFCKCKMLVEFGVQWATHKWGEFKTNRYCIKLDQHIGIFLYLGRNTIQYKKRPLYWSSVKPINDIA